MPAELRLTFLGISCLYLHDESTHILIDPCLTRPRLPSLLGRIAPNLDVIRKCLERAGITRLNAVVLSHTHYDHALDAVQTARETGALLVGSPSAVRLAGGGGLALESCLRTEDERSLTFGRFRLSFIQHPHLSLGMGGILASGNIERPLIPPARAWAYREGGTSAIHCQHPGGSLLVVSSAGAIDPGKLKQYPAETVCLGIGALGFKSKRYRRDYFQTVVRGCGAKRVFLTHWDIFWRPLDKQPIPLYFHQGAINQLTQLAQEEGIELEVFQPWQEVRLLPVMSTAAPTPDP